MDFWIFGRCGIPKVHKISQLEKFIKLDKVQTRNGQLRTGEKQKRGATSRRNGGQIQTEIGRCGEIEQKAGKEAIDKECRSRSPSARLRIERAAMPLIRETLPLIKVTAIGYEKYRHRSEELLKPLKSVTTCPS